MEIYVYGYLCLEVIEKCNLKCDICMRGECTNKRITRSVVEKLFDNVKYIETLVFTGGEVTLAYDEIKMIIDIMKEKNVKVDRYQIIVNGTIYNKRLFDLLRESFKDGAISISCDYFHDKSILEIYKDKVDIALENMIKIMKEPHYKMLYENPNYFYDIGRAKKLDNIRKIKPSIVPFVTTIRKGKYLCVGPEISFDVDGNFINGNSEYKKDSSNCLGNINDENLCDLILRNSIKNNFLSGIGFLKKVYSIDYNYYNISKREKNYVVKDGRVVKEPVIITNDICDETIYDNSNRLILKYNNQRK